MCTVTVAVNASRQGKWVRVVSNRDELRSRGEAQPPAIFPLGARRVLMPVDPQSGGTWIGVNDAGLVAVLLNSNPPGGLPASKLQGKSSRGSLVPSVLLASEMNEAQQIVEAFEAGSYPPFRLLLVSCDSWTHWHSDGSRLHRVEASAMTQPFCFASSGLGDELVQRPRLELFMALCDKHGGFDATVQDRFHHEPMPDAPELGVMMSREAARTVSVTGVSVDLDAGQATMTYEAIGENEGFGDESCGSVIETLRLSGEGLR